MPVSLVSTRCCAPGSSAFASSYGATRGFRLQLSVSSSGLDKFDHLASSYLHSLDLRFCQSASSQSAAGRRVSRRQYRGGAERPVQPHHGRLQHGRWFLFAQGDSVGSFNTAIGAGTLLANTGDQNTATGAGALLSNTSGIQNTANGAFALLSNTTASGNTATGWNALAGNTGGFSNTANGLNALTNNTTGTGNTGIGQTALSNNTTGSSNTALGIGAGQGVSTAFSVIAIGVSGDNVNNSCFIGNIRGATTAVADAIPVVIDSHHQLGTTSSSRRFKKEIKAMAKTSEAILALKPVTFHYKSDNTNRPEFGLIAEEVAKVNPDLVVRDGNGEIYTVRYDAVNAMLLNEFLKEHRRIQQQESTIGQLKSAMAQQRNDFEAAIVQQQKTTEALVARLNEQEARIQKVSAQVEMRKSGSQMLVENQ
jgi:Chaperone of endosialidase